jgi:transcriptional antiterminator RfaH
MHWYLLHTKPRQEQRAMLNLERQGFECYLPMLAVEKLRLGALTVIEEPLFPRYLFIHLSTEFSAKGWGPIRSTKGVSRIVTFGTEPAKVDERLIDALRTQNSAAPDQPQRLFTPGEQLVVTKGPFAGIEAVFQMSDGESRMMVLIELMSKSTSLSLTPASVRKIS